MSSSAVQQVIHRAVSDASFRQQLQSNPASALRGFDLTADESAAISSHDPGRLAAFGVDQRVSKAFGLGGGALNSDPMTDVPNSTGGVTRLEMESGDGSHLAAQESGSAGSGATNAFDSGSAASGATNTMDSGIVGSGATNSLDSGTAGSGATDVLDSGSAGSGAAPTWQDDPQPTVAATESGAPAWRDDAQPLAAADDASGPSAGAVHDVAPADLSLGAADDAPLASLSAVHDVAPVDLSSDSASSVHDVEPADLSATGDDVADQGWSVTDHPHPDAG